jgi:hypothetical protein
MRGENSVDVTKERVGMKRARMRGWFRSSWPVSIVLLALGGLLAVGANAALAQSSDNTPDETEFEKQQRIYRSTGVEVPAGYSIDRSLADYARGLPTGFDRAVGALRAEHRWLDIGAGQGRAILDYFTADYDAANPAGRSARDGKARAVAISIEDRRTPAWYHTSSSLPANQIQYLFGRRFGEYEPDALGKFRVITDLLGGFSYTDGLSEFLQKVLGLLEVEGSFFTLLQDVHSENGGNRPFYAGSRFLTEIENSVGSEVKICTWLRRISCVEVSCEYRQDWRPPVEGYHIKKVCENVAVPALDRTHFAAGTPPERRFKLLGPSSTPGGATSMQTDKPR